MTTPARTVVDLARILPVELGATVAGDALRSGLARPPGLERQLAAAATRVGIARAREAVRLADPRLESVLEGELLDILRRLSWPTPLPQHEIRRNGVFLARVDFAYADQLVAVEADGYRWHSTREQFERDHARAALLGMAGWMQLGFTAAQIRERPRWVAEVVDRVLCSRGRLSDSGDIRPAKGGTDVTAGDTAGGGVGQAGTTGCSPVTR